MYFRVLYQDESLVAIDKPPGFQVHPPEDATHRISKTTNCLYLLRRQLNQYLYPVHRIDRATSGVLVFALEREAATRLNAAFSQRQVKKTYFCVSRGWMDPSGTIERALKNEKGELLPSITNFLTLARVEIPRPVGKFPCGRYSLLRVEPQTGRMHQIRRHFAGIGHPLIGDTTHGDGDHNRLFRDELGLRGLLLKAYAVEFDHPTTGLPLRIHARWGHAWHQLFDLFGVCPFF